MKFCFLPGRCSLFEFCLQFHALPCHQLQPEDSNLVEVEEGLVELRRDEQAVKIQRSVIGWVTCQLSMYSLKYMPLSFVLQHKTLVWHLLEIFDNCCNGDWSQLSQCSVEGLENKICHIHKKNAKRKVIKEPIYKIKIIK